jgi:putative ABC transport system permease protein
MFWKLLREPLRRASDRRRALAAVAAISLGIAVPTAMLTVALDVGDRVGNELRSLGANIIVSPAADSLPVEIGGIDYRPVSEGAYLSESSLKKLKEIFWRNNIVAFAPYLNVPVELAEGQSTLPAVLVGTWFDYPVVQTRTEEFRTGIAALNPSWRLEGAWAGDAATNDDAANQDAVEAVAGATLARRLGLRTGDVVELRVKAAAGAQQSSARSRLRVRGIVTTGGAEDEHIFAPLRAVQRLAGLPGKVRSVAVSALIKPEDTLSRRNPRSMTPVEYDRWYCSPYLSSILHQIGEVLPGTTARAVRQVAETQGNVLGKLNLLMAFLSAVALIASTLSISSLASLAVLERRHEIGLMKAMGAHDMLVAALFLTEMAAQGVVGGTWDSSEGICWRKRWAQRSSMPGLL